MNKGIIFEKIVKQAVNNGWRIFAIEHLSNYNWESLVNKDLETFIFNTNFLKAYFGEEYNCGHYNINQECKKCNDQYNKFCSGKLENWQYHAQQLVILETDEEKLEYLERYL